MMKWKRNPGIRASGEKDSSILRCLADFSLNSIKNFPHVITRALVTYKHLILFNNSHLHVAKLRWTRFFIELRIALHSFLFHEVLHLPCGGLGMSQICISVPLPTFSVPVRFTDPFGNQRRCFLSRERTSKKRNRMPHIQKINSLNNWHFNTKPSG